jgi:hypothetical protein
VWEQGRAPGAGRWAPDLRGRTGQVD